MKPRRGDAIINAEVLDDVPAALWTRDRLERCRAERAPELTRIVIVIYPAVTSGEDADEIGIVIAGKDSGDLGYVPADRSSRYQPCEWGRTAIAAFREFRADRVVAETNPGDALVEAMLRAVEPNIPFTAVHALRGDNTSRSRHFTRGTESTISTRSLSSKTQMCGFTVDFDRARAGHSPDRVNALV